jgi:5-methylcytosine-specific restriction endonuclease McrA
VLRVLRVTPPPRRPPGNTTARGYGHAWRKIRATILRPGTPCHYCGNPATSVDHIIPKALGGTDDRANLAPACARCNSSKRDRPAPGRQATPPCPIHGTRCAGRHTLLQW